ncbi:outer membrane lipase/esterase [Halomonas caseinilytica]|uniref:Outer membrane lipase/esterase n=2 Tax=Halomonas caseinilytica TaxID=438744 RepID=A0A1M6U1Z9_9GAMM|nr:outer membrane lipase/esterase [Halomonas caseinilytica]
MIKGLPSGTTAGITQYFELRRLTATILCAGMGVAGLMASAPAIAYSSVYVFGDSLSDTGQFPDGESGGLNAQRFTNRLGPDHDTTPYGPVATQLLAQKLGLSAIPSTSIGRQQAGLLDGTNYAVGGYTTGQIWASITQEGGSVVQAGTPFDRTQNGYLPAVGGMAAPEALYYINGGGNDFLSGQVTGPEEAVSAAHTLADAVDALAEAGVHALG